MKSTERAASRDAAVSPIKNKTSDNRKNILIMQSVIVTIIDVAIALLVFFAANLVCSGVCESSFVSYMTMLFIPLISFLTAFASFVFTKNLQLSFAVNILLTLIFYIFFNGFEWSMFLWELLYLVNAVIGYVIAFAVRSYKA